MSNSTSNNKMSVMQLTLLTALNMMGSGIIMLPTKLAEIGTFSILSWLVTATGSTAMAYAFAKCGMLSRRPGGMGGYTEYAFGQSGNFMANYTYAVSLIIANVAIAVTVVGLHVAQLPRSQDHGLSLELLRLGRDPAGRGSLALRLVLVQPDALRRIVEPQQRALLQRAQQLDLDDALGLPRS